MTVEYAVGIPTRGRAEVLYETLEAFYSQSLKPQLILVIDNNDFPGRLQLPKPPSDITLKAIVGNGNKSDASGSQQALKYFAQSGFVIGGKWDDDLIPEKTCLEPLVNSVAFGVSAAGGLYPKEGEKRRSKLTSDGHLTIGDGEKRHVQFFEIDCDSPEVEKIGIVHLYSSFVYNIQRAILIGGFCLDYSRHSFRQETDFTMRLNLLDSMRTNQDTNLRVFLSAKAVHKIAPGGVRNFNNLEREFMMGCDQALFLYRMRLLGINII